MVEILALNERKRMRWPLARGCFIRKFLFGTLFSTVPHIPTREVVGRRYFSSLLNSNSLKTCTVKERKFVSFNRLYHKRPVRMGLEVVSEFLEKAPILKAAAITAGYQLLFFVPTVLLRFDKLTDFAGASNFTVLALWSYFGFSSFQARQRLLTSMVILWSARLALYLGYRILFVFGKDNRLDEFRNSASKLLFFWSFQGTWAFVVCLPILLVNIYGKSIPLSRLDYFGCCFFVIGFLCESIADFQKLYFKKRNADHWCDIGLWKYSRHPNYFGELLMWHSLYLISWRGLSLYHRLIAISSPLFITWLLFWVSGIPLLERSADSKYGAILEYQWYKKRTSLLIPLPPSLTERINHWFSQ